MSGPLVAIIGSIHPDRAAKLNLQKVSVGMQAAEAIGRALAKHGCRIVAYSSEVWSIEPLIVKGYVAELARGGKAKNTAECIEVRYSTNGHIPNFDEQEHHRPLFSPQPDSSPGWTSSFYKPLAEVDAVILLGGGDTTYIAGTVALSHGKSVVAVGAFGGTAKTIWDELVFDPELLKRSEKDKMNPPIWGDEDSDKIIENMLAHIKRLEEKRKKRDDGLRQSQAIPHICAAVLAFVLAFIPAPFTWDDPSMHKVILMSLLIYAPLLSGISGATARSAFDAVGSKAPKEVPNLARTIGLGAIAGGMAGALFVITQLMAISPEVLGPTWTKMAGRLVPLSVLIGFIGGWTLDAVFQKLSGTTVISDKVLETLLSGRANR